MTQARFYMPGTLVRASAEHANEYFDECTRTVHGISMRLGVATWSDFSADCVNGDARWNFAILNRLVTRSIQAYMIAMGDPANSADAIQRVLFIASKVHVYQVPPLTSNKGHTAATWTENEPIFTARLRIVESADSASDREGQKANLSTSIRLEDPSSGELFAAAPYTHPSAVAHCVDSSRFFAVRVVGDGGMKATLGIGFEERPEAFDFGVALQDARKILGLDDGPSTASSKGARKAEDKPEPKKDYSLKEGETITVNIGGKPGGLTGQDDSATNNASISAVPFLPPPPSADEVKMNMANIGKQSTTHSTQKQTSQDLGFDDGEFGEFQ